MTRMEQRNIKKRNIKILIGIVAIIYISMSSLSYAYFVARENEKIKEKIMNYDSDVKVYYLKKEILKEFY